MEARSGTLVLSGKKIPLGRYLSYEQYIIKTPHTVLIPFGLVTTRKLNLLFDKTANVLKVTDREIRHQKREYNFYVWHFEDWKYKMKVMFQNR